MNTKLIRETKCLLSFTWDAVFHGKISVLNNFGEDLFLFVTNLCVENVQLVSIKNLSEAALFVSHLHC